MIEPATGAGAASYSQGAAGVSTSGTQELGRDAFLKLLVTQLRYQNPLNPVGDQQFLSDLAQFSVLERLEQVADATAGLRQLQGLSLLGRRVGLEDGSVGLVESVVLTAEGPLLRLEGGAEAALHQVVSVALGDAP